MGPIRANPSPLPGRTAGAITALQLFHARTRRQPTVVQPQGFGHRRRSLALAAAELAKTFSSFRFHQLFGSTPSASTPRPRPALEGAHGHFSSATILDNG